MVSTDYLKKTMPAIPFSTGKTCLKIVICAASLLFASFSIRNKSEELLKKMYEHYHGKWYRTLTFSQTTENYRQDSLIKTSTWYEYVLFPDKFRIDFGDP